MLISYEHYILIVKPIIIINEYLVDAHAHQL